jgi:biotin carboxyl carrier protein
VDSPAVSHGKAIPVDEETEIGGAMSEVEVVLKLKNVNPRTRRNILVKWLKREGQPIERGEPLYVVETHKGVIEVASEFDGIVQRLLIARGSFVAGLQDIAIIRIDADGSEAPRSTGDGNDRREGGYSLESN